AVLLEWTKSPSEGVKGYVITRGEGAHPWQTEMTEIAQVKAGATSYRDTSVKPWKLAFYQVRALGKDGAPSETAVLGQTQPRVVEDVVVSVIKAKEVRLRWKSPAADVVGYHVERAVVEVFSEDELKRLKTDTAPLADPSVGTIKAVGAFRRLTKTPLTKVEY